MYCLDHTVTTLYQRKNRHKGVAKSKQKAAASKKELSSLWDLEDMASYERIVRSDIIQAGKQFQTVKDELVYKDEEVLEMGMLKVQPLQHLDEEILKYRDQIQSCVSEADQVKDGVPGRLLSKVNGVIEEAGRGKTTLYKASAMLEFTSDAFLYARRSARDRFDLSRTYGKKLEECDAEFTKMMSARVYAKMEEAQQCQNKCIECVERAVAEAENDVRARDRRELEEEEQWKMVNNLEEVQSAVRESIKDEVSELDMINVHCRTDINSIESSMARFTLDMRKASDTCARQENDKNSKLQRNRDEQESLRRRLQQLEQEEKQLERDIDDGRMEESEARQVRDNAHKQVDEWRRKIEDLQERVETSLNIMKQMTEVTETILSDAQEKQRAVREKLYMLEVEGLLGKRDALMAHGVMCMLISSDCESNIRAIEEELVRLEKAKRAASKTMLTAKVDSAKRDIQINNETKQNYEKQCEENKEKLSRISHALQQVDDKLRKVKSSLRLDSMNDRYKERRSLMEQVFEQDGVQGIRFCSTKQYH